ncbi:MAG: hypothetical protein WC457_03820 [Patescibacteria group bacterium]
MGILARIVEGLSEVVREILHDKEERHSSSPGMNVNTRLADAEAKERARRRLEKARLTIAYCDRAACESQPTAPPYGMTDEAVNGK